MKYRGKFGRRNLEFFTPIHFVTKTLALVNILSFRASNNKFPPVSRMSHIGLMCLQIQQFKHNTFNTTNLLFPNSYVHKVSPMLYLFFSI